MISKNFVRPTNPYWTCPPRKDTSAAVRKKRTAMNWRALCFEDNVKPSLLPCVYDAPCLLLWKQHLGQPWCTKAGPLSEWSLLYCPRHPMQPGPTIKVTTVRGVLSCKCVLSPKKKKLFVLELLIGLQSNSINPEWSFSFQFSFTNFSLISLIPLAFTSNDFSRASSTSIKPNFLCNPQLWRTFKSKRVGQT